jgi:hypothetical protein
MLQVWRDAKIVPMDKQKASKLLAILAPVILIVVAVLGVIFPRTGMYLIMGAIILLAVVASRLKS